MSTWSSGDDENWWRGDGAFESSSTPWDGAERNLVDWEIGKRYQFKDFSPCDAIPLSAPTRLDPSFLDFSEGVLICVIEKGEQFAPAIKADGPMGIDQFISWNLKGRPAVIKGGERGTLIFRGKPSDSEGDSTSEFFVGLDISSGGTKLS